MPSRAVILKSNLSATSLVRSMLGVICKVRPKSWYCTCGMVAEEERLFKLIPRPAKVLESPALVSPGMLTEEAPMLE